MRSRWFLFLALASLIVVLTALAYVLLPSPRFLREEYVGGKYECIIGITGEDPRGFEIGRLFYVINGVEHEGYFNAYLRDALDWIEAHTPENTVFLNWWDYGHMVVGYAQRESVIRNPSQEALISVQDTSEFKEFDPHEMIVDVAKALTITNENVTLDIMSKYGATYIFVTTEDGTGKPYWIFHFAGLNFTNYMNADWQPTGLAFDPDQYNELGKETVIYRMLITAEIQGLTEVYSDENVRVYKCSSEISP